MNISIIAAKPIDNDAQGRLTLIPVGEKINGLIINFSQN
jgi:hypothetical protein